MKATLVVRIAAGIVLILSASGFLIQGGLSRYAQFGIPGQSDWRLIAIGLLLAGVGGVLLRPIKRWGRR